MLVLVPHGLLGLVVASLAAAYMSTISTHLNWGASYIVDDVYRRFLAPDRDERHYVGVARIATVGLIALAAALSLWLDNALQAFQILLQIGAGTGSIFLLRWFWWRVNAWSELSGMIISFIVALYFEVVHVKLGLTPIDPTVRLLLGVAITTAGWVTVTLLTRPADRATLQAFYDKITPIEQGWQNGVDTSRGGEPMDVRAAIAAWFLAIVAVFSALFGTGYVLYGRLLMSGMCLVILAIAVGGLFRVFPRVGLR
jgi:Na+/proline symporter